MGAWQWLMEGTGGRRVVKLVRALRKGWIKREADKLPEQAPVYLLWQDDGLAADHTLAGALPACCPLLAPRHRPPASMPLSEAFGRELPCLPACLLPACLFACLPACLLRHE